VPRLRAVVLGLALAACTTRPAVAAADAGWVAAAAHRGIAYFLRNAPAGVARYDMTARHWLSPVPVAAGATALAVGDPGLYVAFGRRISRFPLAGGPEQHLLNTAGPVRELLLAGPLVASVQASDGLLAIDSASGAILDETGTFYASYGLAGLSAAPTRWRIFGRDQGLSPPDIVAEGFVPATGTFFDEHDSPYHGDYPGASRTFVFPDETRVVDDAGIVYATADLRFVGSLGGALDDVGFVGTLPIVLRGATLFVYDAAYREVGRHALPGPASRAFVQDDTVFAFGTSGSDFTVTAVPIADIGPAVPGAPVDPNGLAYAFDGFVQANDGTVYVLSAANLSIFHWLPATRAYGPTIALCDVPSYLAYSPVTDRLFVAYPSGAITQIAPGGPDAELPFATLPQPPCGLATAGDLVFACVPDASWASHLTYAPDGTLASQKQLTYRSREYVWSPERRKMYFFRDDTSPNDILSEDIDPAGTLGADLDAPYHGGFAFRHPIRLGPQSSTVLTGDGLFFDPVTLEQVGSLANEIDDAAWVGSTLYTIRRVAPAPEPFETAAPAGGISEVQAWGPGTHPLLSARPVPGLPERLFVAGTTPIAVTRVGGIPRWIPLTCGDGVVDAYEACDGANLGGQSCASLGLGGGTLGCTAGCRLDASGCTIPPRCGDGVLDRPDELCDGTDFGALAGDVTCDAFGRNGGTLACSSDCADVVLDRCNTCGNGVVDFGGDEQCDGTNLAGATCTSQGFSGGTLACTPTCRFDTDACIHDCATQPCADGDPCTHDVCDASTGCSHVAEPDCVRTSGVLVTSATATIQRGDLTGDCAGRCGTRVDGALIVGADGTYRAPSEQTTSCPGTPTVIPHEVGVVRPGRHGREILVPTNLRDVLHAVGVCGGFKVKLRSVKEWIRRDGGVITEGRIVLVTRERRGGDTIDVRRAARFAAPGQLVTPPPGFRRLPDCSLGLRLHCHAR